MLAPSMSLSQRQIDALGHIADQCQKALGLAARVGTREKVENDWEAQYALARCLEIIGEAGKRLGPQFHQAHAGLPWKLITGMRDKLIHHYDRVNPGILWETVTNDLPTVRQVVEEALRTEAPPPTADGVDG